VNSPTWAHLDLEQVAAVARARPRIELLDSRGVGPRFLATVAWVHDVAATGEEPYYGINTGFGSKANSALPRSDMQWVSRNLIVSHAAGVGDYLPVEVVRAAMLIRANSLLRGFSGVRLELVNMLLTLLNEGVTPAVPRYGSLGASGDLAPLSHLAQVFTRPPDGSQAAIGEGEYDESGRAFVDGAAARPAMVVARTERRAGASRHYGLASGRSALEMIGREPLVLGPKEGLALNNGTTFSAALAALAAVDAERLVRTAEVSTALVIEATLGFRDAFLPQIHQVRGHPGQMASAARILGYLEGSRLADGGADLDPRVKPPQDPYSVRVAPQVLGAAADAIGFVRGVLTREVNAATDNPLIFVDVPESEDPLPIRGVGGSQETPFEAIPPLERDYKVVSGGNFHGAPIGYAADLLAIVVTDVASLSERQIFRLIDPKLNFGLAPYLIPDQPGHEGLTSGVMIPQYVAASLVSACKTLAHPDSVDSIPSSANQEDHVSMSMNAALHAREVVEMAESVLAICLLTAYLGVDARRRRLAAIGDPAFDGQLDHREVAFLAAHGRDPAAIALGRGTAVAMAAIEQALFGGPHPLPPLAAAPTDRDRQFAPYLDRLVALLQSGNLLRELGTE